MITIEQKEILNWMKDSLESEILCIQREIANSNIREIRAAELAGMNMAYARVVDRINKIIRGEG